MAVRIGYEVELLSPMGAAAIRKNIAQIGIELDRAEGHYENWILKGDGSLRGSGGRGNNGHEIVSPILELEEGLEKMKLVFDWMAANGHYTNSSCGFHVGVSLDPNVMRRMDELKLVLLFDANSVLRNFGRQHSTYCRPLKREMMNNIRRQAPYWNLGRQVGYVNGNWRANMDDLDKIRLLIPHEKFTSSNLSKLAMDPPYVEFRCMGNENYHGRFEDVQATVRYYAEMIQAACDTDAEREKFNTEANRLLRMVNRVRVMETARHAEQVERERRAEEERVRPLMERDAARANRRAARVPFVRRRAQRMAEEAATQGRLALEELDLAIMTAREIRNRVRATEPQAEVPNPE